MEETLILNQNQKIFKYENVDVLLSVIKEVKFYDCAIKCERMRMLCVS